MKRRRVIGAVLALLLLASVVQVIRARYEDAARAREYEAAARLAGLAEPEQEEETPPPAPSAAETEEELVPEEVLALAGIDLAALQEVNPEVVGWIEIPDTNLSYPLLQGEDNQYYLRHTWTKEVIGGGSVFLECTNSRDLSDRHVIVYGHKMRDGTMFGVLHEYSDISFWQEHPRAYIVHDGRVDCYDIFAACEAGVQSIIYRLDIEESGLQEELIRYALDNSVLDTGIIPEDTDQILTMSTCTGHGHATRWIVQAVFSESVPMLQRTNENKAD